MRPGTRSLVYLLTSALSFGGVSALVPPINSERTSAGLVVADLSSSAEPGLVFGPLLAVGRAPLVDYLWMRATNLKDEGRFFDAFQLAETIGRLQPRFAAVWSFNAWNMAYNISVTFRSPEERWRWVRNGIELLRDQGIKHNPRNVRMYKELSWIFFHKVGDYMDEMHMYYKLQLALLVEDILGPGPEPDWTGLAAAPLQWKDLVADPKVAELARLFKKAGEDVSQPSIYLGLLQRSKLSPDVHELMTKKSYGESRHRIEMFWRAKRLRDELKIDPVRVIKLREVFGPLDFRVADSQSLYWANLGVEISSGNRLALDIDKLNTDRIEVYCLQNLFRRGRLIMSPNAAEGEYPMLLPDVRFADKMRDAFIAVSNNYPKQPGQGVVHENFKSAMINFMREASLRFNEAGQIEKSREYFEWLRTNVPNDPAYQKGYDYFIARQWHDTNEFVQQRDVTSRIYNLLATGVQMIGYDRENEGATYIALARKTWNEYEKSQNNNRYRLQAFEEIYEFIVHEMGQRMSDITYRKILDRTGFKASTTQRALTTAPVDESGE